MEFSSLNLSRLRQTPAYNEVLELLITPVLWLIRCEVQRPERHMNKLQEIQTSNTNNVARGEFLLHYARYIE